MPVQNQQDEGAKVGDQIGGYRLLSRLGDGSTSTVFLGEHVRLGRRAAIKVLFSDFSDDPRTVERLLTEARVVNDIRHPNIVDISDFVEQASPRRVALVMEHIEGPSLKTFRGRPLAPTRALALAVQLVDAVQAAHARGVIHRDLKPDNLLLTFDPDPSPERPLELKVVDFGIAKIQGPQGQGMTVSGTMLGTPAYMAPEQIAGSPAPSAATDVFALGAVVYELLTGERAYPSMRLQETVRAKLRGEVPELRALPFEGSEDLWVVLRRCLQRHPTARPGLNEVRSAIERALRRAAGEHMTDALELPTLGLTAGTLLPAPAATELSSVPEGVVQDALRGRHETPAQTPEALLAMLQAQDVLDEEDEVGTELAQPSLDLPRLEHAATEQASPDLPAWSTALNNVATAMASSGIPDHGSSPTNRVLDALGHEITEPPDPHTTPGHEVLRGLMGPAGVAGPGPIGNHETASVARQPALHGAPPGEDATLPPQEPSSQDSLPEPKRAAGSGQRALTRSPSVRPDRLFASAVGLQPARSTPSVPQASARPPASGSWGLRLFLILVLAACVLGGALAAGFIRLPTRHKAAPVLAPRPKPVTAPSATPH